MNQEINNLEQARPDIYKAMEIAWETALIYANNICVQKCDEHNNDDHIEAANAIHECTVKIRDGIKYRPDEIFKSKPEAQQLTGMTVYVPTPDWKKKFCEAWGCKSLKELDEATNLTIEWIEKNAFTPLSIPDINSLQAENEKLKAENLRLVEQQVEVAWEVEEDKLGLSDDDKKAMEEMVDEVFKSLDEEKKYISSLQSKIERLTKENEEVRCKNIAFETCNYVLKKTIAELVEENERLKKENQCLDNLIKGLCDVKNGLIGAMKNIAHECGVVNMSSHKQMKDTIENTLAIADEQIENNL